MNRTARPAVLVALVALAALFASACAVPRMSEAGALPDADDTGDAFDRMRGPTYAARMALLTDNSDAWVARWQLLASAQSTIDASYFIVENDAFGRAFLGHLLAKADDGVFVRLLIDGRGSAGFSFPLFGRDDLQELVGSGNADVRVFNPPLNQLARMLVERSPIPAATSTHNKILVVDGATAITGGRNIARAYFAGGDELATSVSDADAVVAGDGAVHAINAAMTRDFESSDADVVGADVINVDSQKALLLASYVAMDAWLHARVPAAPPDVAARALDTFVDAYAARRLSQRTTRRIDGVIAQIVSAGTLYGKLASSPAPWSPALVDVDVRVVESASRAVRADHSANDAFLRAIDGAQSEIIVETPTFILTPQQLAALSLAARRGVAITVITNSPVSSDNPSAMALFIDSWPELCARVPGLRIFVAATPHMLHGKRAIVDDLAFIGSYNFDPFSAHLNSELVLATPSPAIRDRIRAGLVAESESADVLEYKIRRAPDGNALRYPPGSKHAGDVVVAYGPRQHLPREQIEELERLKTALIGIRSMWDFSVVAW